MADRIDIAEGAGRWLAGRTSRRSFLGRLGRAAVFVASGSTVAALLAADEAEARVCGQSGVAPKCPTYDCVGGIWGWCWYATGCCAGGGLKKICDCCSEVDFVHGYCPSGTNVKCIVESCNADPRVQVVSLHRVPTDDVVAASAGIIRARFAPGEAPQVWMMRVDQPLHAAVTTPLAARDGAAILLSGSGVLSAPTIAALQHLASKRVVLIGSFDSAFRASLERYGVTVEERTLPADVGGYSEVVADQLLIGGARRAVCIEPSGVSLAAAPIAAGLAAAKGYPLMIGVDRSARFATRDDGPRPVATYLVGPEASSRAGEVAGGHPLRSSSLTALSAEALDMAVRVERGLASRIVLLPEGGVGAVAGLSMGGPVVIHEPGGIGSVHDALLVTRGGFRTIALAGATGALSTDAYYRLQSVVNEFDAHLLIGVPGQGLPVISQPQSERPIGRARRAGSGGLERSSSYWTGRTKGLNEGR
ncbi:MAG: hypothetical protein ACR2H3_10895 [Acidimicrobiales bacterium]